MLPHVDFCVFCDGFALLPGDGFVEGGFYVIMDDIFDLIGIRSVVFVLEFIQVSAVVFQDDRDF